MKVGWDRRMKIYILFINIIYMCVLYVYINKQNLEILRKLLDTFFKVCAITKIPSKIICGIIRYSETDMLYIVISKYVGLQRVSKFILIIRSTVHVMFQLTGTESCRRESFLLYYLYDFCVKYFG